MEDSFFEAKYPEKSRETEISQILSYVKQGNCAQLISIPGAGRSTLLGLLAYNHHVRSYHLQENAENYHFVMVSFSEIYNKPALEALKLIFLEIIDSLEERTNMYDVYTKAKTIMTESIALHDELVLFQGLKKVCDVLTLEKGLTLVLLFDQFETYIPMLTPDFFSYCKTLRNRAKYKFSIVFSVSKPLEYFLEPALLNDFSEFVQQHTIYLSLYDDVSLMFRLSFIEQAMGKTLDAADLKQLITQTAGHARLTRLALQNILTKDTPTIPPVSDLLLDIHIQKALTEIWQTLNPAEQTHFIKNLFPSVLDDEHSQYLKHVGLMSDTAVVLPLFSAFVEKKREEAKSKPQSIHINEAGTILKGDTEISDSLTATEFRLLHFFLQHPQTILERNSIIQGVWQDTKTVLGVTDQALDQLIFRLRRKIEEDPNNPTHLLTIKGRGFKFEP